MKVLITGATGFLGKHVYQELLKKKYTIFALSRSAQIEDLDFYELDILDHKKTNTLVENIRPDILIHLAWDVEHEKYWDSSKNIDYELASINLIEAFIANGGRKVLAAGTCAEYPELPVLISENHNSNLDDLSLYGRSKKRVYEHLCLKQQVGLEFTWFRIFGIFGCGEDKRRLFPSMVHSILNNKKPSLRSPNSFYDYVCVSDLASFIVQCIEGDALGAVNIGSGTSRSVMDYYEIFESYIRTGRLNLINNAQEVDSKSRMPNCQKLSSVTSNFNDSLRRGISSMLETHV